MLQAINKCFVRGFCEKNGNLARTYPTLSPCCLLGCFSTSHTVTIHAPIQVAQGLLDHTNSVLGASQHLSRRTLEDLLCLYGITTLSPEMDPGASLTPILLTALL